MSDRHTQSEARPHSPEWVVMVVSRDPAGKPNVMPAGWGMHCSGTPHYMAVSIAYSRYTYECIRATGEFVFAWAGEGQAELVEQTGSTSGRDIDKFEDFRIPWSEPEVIAVPLLDGAASNLECKVVHEYESGDHAIFVGEVVASHQPEPPIRRLFNFKRVYMVAVAADDSE
jgi:flavin reductase (DIM6/NTAB) family NADH-FMN oxidoreductase RutF